MCLLPFKRWLNFFSLVTQFPNEKFYTIMTIMLCDILTALYLFLIFKFPSLKPNKVTVETFLLPKLFPLFAVDKKNTIKG